MVSFRQARVIPWQEIHTLDWTALGSRQIKGVVWLDPVEALQLGIVAGRQSVTLIEFHSTKGPSFYAYKGVPQEIAQTVVDADSPGKQLNLAIKGAYEYLKLEVQEPWDSSLRCSGIGVTMLRKSCRMAMPS